MTAARIKTQLTPILQRLKSLTKECSEDMHEPDCQEVYVRKVAGRKLDNAYGAGSHTVGIWGKNPERRFLLVNKDTGEQEWFNLADILALARKARL
jgi:hypothetical protein